MFKKQHLPFENTNLFNKLVLDYLSKHPDAKSLYTHFPDKEGYQALLKQADLYTTINRSLLVKALTQQASLVSNTTSASLKNITALENKNCFTVTTGHQLCLFTGPLYFIYKILSCINLSERLNTSFPDKQFVPVYWMASEDHDFEEVNHAFAFGKKIEWQSKQTGAVGNFNTSELSSVIDALETVLGPGENAKQLVSIFRKAYLENKNLADATRYLVNALFGEFGLVIADGNDALLKSEFRTTIKEDIFENTPYKSVNDTITHLNSKNYSTQVKPREINCFLLSDKSRNRIEKKGDLFNVVNTSINYTKEELEKIIDSEPEKISPNVVLRPLYQQSILPNIAYVGGPGELAYWLEYKAMFEKMSVQFPILQPRDCVMLIDSTIQQKLLKLGIPVASIFKSENELVNEFVAEKGLTISLDDEKNKLVALFDALATKTLSIDKTIEAAVKAENQKALNSINAIEAKLNKALKQRLDVELNQIKNSRAKLYPENIAQERYDNFSMYFSKFGPNFIPEVKKQLLDHELAYLILLES